MFSRTGVIMSKVDGVTKQKGIGFSMEKGLFGFFSLFPLDRLGCIWTYSMHGRLLFSLLT